MFYSHEILTSRKYGVATVWLVATLGSRSSLKKVNRKAILDVDVPKACETILAPEVPMALRLQSSLLYGVSRVYSQQCGYVLTDVQHTHNHIQALYRVVKSTQLDLDTGRAKPEQITVQDDPAFVPDLLLSGMGVDFSKLDIVSISPRDSVLSPHTEEAHRSGLASSEHALPGLFIPTSDTGLGGDIGGFVFPGNEVSSAYRASRTGFEVPPPEDEDIGFLPDVSFEFDDEGNVHEFAPGEMPSRAPAERRRARPNSDAADSEVRREHEGGRVGFNLGRPLDQGYDITMGDDFILPEAEPFPGRPGPFRAQSAAHKSSSLDEDELSSEHVHASLRPKLRTVRIIPADETTELHNADLASWNANYITNMDAAKKSKRSHQTSTQAKKRAAFLVFGSGVGDVGTRIGGSMLAGPLSMFSGDALRVALSIEAPSLTGRKRGRPPNEVVEEDEQRRTRSRSGDIEDQLGRGELLMEDELSLPLHDDAIEIGRQASVELQDFSSAMPWNISSSVRGSRAGSATLRGRPLMPSSVGGFPSSVAGPSSLAGVGGGEPYSLPRRPGSRVLSASPLISRGRGLERLSSLEVREVAADEAAAGPVPPAEEEEDDLYAPEAFLLSPFRPAHPLGTPSPPLLPVPRQTKEPLDRESYNFLDFLRTHAAAVPRAPAPAPTDDDDGEDELAPTQLPRAGDAQRSVRVSFETLLPPQDTAKAVAAQALHHVLFLASREMVGVRQSVEYGEIELWVDRV
ncbi:MAG: hypothetical protein M1833_006269 [Piccolia ochrophora]|nr:MAG: hypothetical protein M1833_006269 [Piccolia ochrophora]